MKHDDEADSEAFAASQKKFEAASVGMEINDEGKAETAMEQLMKFRSAAAEAKTEYQVSAMELPHCQEQLKQKEAKFRSSSADSGDLKAKIGQVETEVKSLERDLTKVNFPGEDAMNQLQQRREQLRNECHNLRSRVADFVARRPYTTFAYTDPTPNFDRSGVYDTVCRLIKVNNPATAFALEIAAGGRVSLLEKC